MLDLVSSNTTKLTPFQQTASDCAGKVEQWGGVIADSCKSTTGKIQNSVSKLGIAEKTEAVVDYLTSREPGPILRTLNRIDGILEEEMPNWSLQTKLDAIGTSIERLFQPLTKFNEWINSNGDGHWAKQLAICLAKTPLRVVRNIIHMLYKLISGIVYTAVHPLKSLNHLAKMTVKLLNEFANPENWSKLGVGLLGASVGQGCFSTWPIASIGVVIGAALTFSGLSFVAFKAALKAEQGKKLQGVGEKLLSNIQELPETFLTAFVGGLAVGHVQHAIKDYWIDDRLYLSGLEETPKFMNYLNPFAQRPHYKWHGSWYHNHINTHLEQYTPELFTLNKVAPLAVGAGAFAAERVGRIS